MIFLRNLNKFCFQFFYSFNAATMAILDIFFIFFSMKNHLIFPIKLQRVNSVLANEENGNLPAGIWLISQFLEWRCCKWSTWLPKRDGLLSRRGWNKEEVVPSIAWGIPDDADADADATAAVHGKCTFCNELKTLSSLVMPLPPSSATQSPLTPASSLYFTLHSFSHSFIHLLQHCCEAANNDVV